MSFELICSMNNDVVEVNIKANGLVTIIQKGIFKKNTPEIIMLNYEQMQTIVDFYTKNNPTKL